MVDRLYDTTRTGELLGGLHPNDVLRLIHDGRLHAKKQRVRGKDLCPRYYVTATEISRYIHELPDAGDAPAPGTVEAGKKADRKPAGLRKELASIRTEYIK